MRRLLKSALLVLAACLFLPAISIASTNSTTQNVKDIINAKTREGEVLKHAEDKILISETRDGDVMREEP